MNADSIDASTLFGTERSTPSNGGTDSTEPHYEPPRIIGSFNGGQADNENAIIVYSRGVFNTLYNEEYDDVVLVSIRAKGAVGAVPRGWIPSESKLLFTGKDYLHFFDGYNTYMEKHPIGYHCYGLYQHGNNIIVHWYK